MYDENIKFNLAFIIELNNNIATITKHGAVKDVNNYAQKLKMFNEYNHLRLKFEFVTFSFTDLVDNSTQAKIVNFMINHSVNTLTYKLANAIKENNEDRISEIFKEMIKLEERPI